MARPNSFWDVLSETANYASEAIPAAQRENRAMAQEQERYGLRAQQEQDRLGETKRYHNEMIGLSRDNLNFQKQKYAHPTEDPTFDKLLADVLKNKGNGKYSPQVENDVLEANSERHPGRAEPKEKEPPNFIGDIGEDYDKRMNTYGIQMTRANDTGVVPTEPTILGSFNRFRGQFPRYGVNPDSIAAGVGLQPWELNTVDSLPPANSGGLRSQIRQTPPAGNDLESRGRQEFGDWDELTPEEKQAIARQEGWIQ